MNTTIRIINGRVLRQHALIKQDLWIRNGKIVTPQPHADEEIDAQGFIVAPGYIDLQINGAHGFDFSSQPDALNKVSKILPKYGVTSFLATVVTSSPEVYQKILPYLQPYKEEGAQLLGIHLEGPFLNPDFCGAHDKNDIVNDEISMNKLLSCYGSLNGIKLITMAPEIKGAYQVIKELNKQGIKVAIGHSAATQSQVEHAIQAGASMVTHLFNAMTPFHHRNPGIIGTALTDSRLKFSIIADGLHLDSTAIQIAWRCRPDGLFLVSDATAALGLKETNTVLGNQKIIASNASSLLSETKALAGAAIGLDEAVRKFKKISGCSDVQAIEAASLKPAEALGIENKGSLELEKDADLIFLDDDLNIKKCFSLGFPLMED